jgi:hypothetical protein
MGSGLVKGQADFLLLGDFNVMCAYCGRKRKASGMKRDNDFARGLWCCPEHADDRHPQEYARGVKEQMASPFVQPPLIAFTSLPAGFPLTVNPSQLVLVEQGEVPLLIEGGGQTAIDTETAFQLVTEPTEFTGYATAIIPPWIPLGPVGDPSTVFVISITWSWIAGGANIQIVSPNSVGTQFLTNGTGMNGVAQVVVVDSLDQISTAYLSVSS